MAVTSRMLAVGGVLLLAACSTGSGADDVDRGAVTSTAPSTTAAVGTTPPTSAPATSAPATSAPVPTTTPREDCVVVVRPGDSLGAIANRIDDDAVTVASLREENRLYQDDIIHPDDELDVCIGNDLDDVTGASRLPPGPAAVEAQQRRLNELFAPYTIAELAVDGDSGPLTRQMLCAARMGLGLRVSNESMSEDSPEEDALFEAASLSIPDGAATWASRWILVDKTCQIMFVGEADERIVDVFPTSTGEPGFETHDVRSAAAYRYDPALDNDGWHDSSRFPAAVDNPLNGNMYKPLYFNGGQAIHGANYVPPEPRSKGCARLFPWHHDLLLTWLGLDDLTEVTWQEQRIGAIVTVRGEYREV
jgi:hypothetical protein